MLAGFAAAPYRHEVTLRIHGTVDRIRSRLPAGVATVEELGQPEEPVPSTQPVEPEEPVSPTQPVEPVPPADPAADRAAERWLRVELRVEDLDWLPAVLASLDRPFVIERPAELRDLVAALADRLMSCARQV